MREHIQKDLQRVVENAKEEWKKRYFSLAHEFLLEHETFEGGEIKQYCKQRGLEDPHTHNLWGAMVRLLATNKKWTAKLGEVTPTTSHTHIDKVGEWISLIFKGEATPYQIVTTAEELDDVLTIIDEDPAALDFEGWTIVRLAQIYNDKGWWVIDFGEKGNNWFKDVAHWFEDGTWIAFNSGHEKRCFAEHGDAYPTVWDSANLRKAIMGGGHMSLKALVGWELEIEMDKTEQASDWDIGELTQSQLDYAADDAKLTWEAWQKMWKRATQGQKDCFNMFDGMTDAVMEMEGNGLKLDPVHHSGLIKDWTRMFNEREKELRELITKAEVENLNSGHQLTDYFLSILPDEMLEPWPKTEKTGLLSMKNRDLIDMAGYFGDNMISSTLRLLAERTTLNKYLSSFGDTLLTHAKNGGGRVHARYNIAAAITGRFSSSGPNLQQIPRDRDFFGERLSIRKGFIAEPGNLLVSFDYSGIEMVMIAILSGDEQLLDDVIYGDPHAVMAEYVAGRKIDKSDTKDYELRQSMKAVNFGIVYGTTALGLAGRQGWSFEYAQDLLDYWAGRYPTAWNLRNEVQQEARDNDGYIKMIDGGTIYMGKKAGMTKCANYPVQRAALSVMANAIIRHKDSMDDLRDRYPRDAKRLMFCSTIHDALIDEAKESLAPVVMETMKTDMLEGYFDVFPELRDVPADRLLEGGMGPSWGELEEV